MERIEGPGKYPAPFLPGTARRGILTCFALSLFSRQGGLEDEEAII
jgi:hypothetical protein